MNKKIKWVAAGLISCMLFCGCGSKEILMPSSSSEYKESDYETVVQEMKEIGFHKIKTEKLEDLKNGSRDGRIESVSIDGEETFGKEARFPSGAEVVITYHTTIKYELPDLKDAVKNKEYAALEKELKNIGFTAVYPEPLDDLEINSPDQGKIQKVTVDGSTKVEEGKKYPIDTEIMIYYHSVNKTYAPIASTDLENKNYKKIEETFKKAGFVNVTVQPMNDLIFGWIHRDGDVERVTIGETEEFDTKSIFKKDDEVVIYYHTFEKDQDEMEVINAENNEEFARFISSTDDLDPYLKEFTDKYMNSIIEFEGNIAYITSHEGYDSRYDALIYTGDYSETEIYGPMFKIDNFNMEDLGLTGDQAPSRIKEGQNYRIAARIIGFNPDTGTTELDPVLFSLR